MLKKFMVFLFFLLFFAFHIYAYDVTYTENTIDTKPILELIPEEIKEYFPDGFMEGEDAVSAAKNVSFSGFTSFLINMLQSTLKPFTKTFSSLLGVIIISSMINTAKNSITNENMAKVLNLVTILSVSLVSYNILNDVWKNVEYFMRNMDVLLGALLPVMTLLYTMGGNVSTAVVNSSGTAILLSVMNVICQYGLFPVLKILYGLSLAMSVGGFKGIEGISKSVRTVVTVVLSGLMSVLSIFLLFKTNLAVATDSVTVRTVKFAGSFIPVIGSALGDSIRSIMSGLSLIKSSAGFVGIMIILFITFPVLVNITANKLSFSFANGIAELLGCEKEGQLLKEFSSLLNFALAITVVVSVLFVFELTIFINTSLVLGGG